MHYIIHCRELQMSVDDKISDQTRPEAWEDLSAGMLCSVLAKLPRLDHHYPAHPVFYKEELQL